VAVYSVHRGPNLSTDEDVFCGDLYRWVMTAGLSHTRRRRSTISAGTSTRGRRDKPLLAITPATTHQADYLRVALKRKYSVRRDGSKILIWERTGDDASIGPLLQALEDCLTDHDIPQITLEVNGRHYVMYRQADA
jgi:hypothetical protein